jgi:hypothetical protein
MRPKKLASCGYAICNSQRDAIRFLELLRGVSSITFPHGVLLEVKKNKGE